jgi:hypothetical protein
MKRKGLFAMIAFSLLTLCLSCEKKGDPIVLHFNETECANPWTQIENGVSNNDPDYQNKVKKFLENQSIEIKAISVSDDGPLNGCFSCFCTTGRRINITTYSEDKKHAVEIGFYDGD